MRSKLLRSGSILFAFASFVALIAPPARAADEDPKTKTDGDEDGDKPKKRKKKAEGDEATGDAAKPKGEDEGDEDADKPKKRRRAKKEDGDEEEGAKPAKAAAVDETAGLKEIGTDSVAATSPIGRVKIDNHLPTEVGKWGWSWFGDSSFGPTSPTGGDIKISMVGVRNWFSPKMGWEAGTGLTLSKAAGDGAPTNYCWGFTGGMLYSLARYEYVNVFAAGRAVIVPFCKPQGETTDPVANVTTSPGSIFQLGLSGEVAVEIFLDAFQIFHTGPMIKTSRSMSITFGSGLSIRYTKIGDTTVTDNATGASTTAGSGSSTGVNTTNVVSGASNFVGSPTGSVAFTYYF